MLYPNKLKVILLKKNNFDYNKQIHNKFYFSIKPLKSLKQQFKMLYFI
jgi:hypothetical protein